MRELESLSEIAVVIATSDRFDLLSDRALQSVVEQTCHPDYLVVIDDSRLENCRFRNRDLVVSLNLPGCRVTYLENLRTEGASGSWNTALDFLLRETEDPSRLYVAILDDDDAWAPSYLERCNAMAYGFNLDMVAADLRRIESDVKVPLVGAGPSELRAEEFLVGNPGIQGSNLFLRLNVLLAAGGFDEALRSSTDRDLCIRLADLGIVRYGRLPVALVDHYAIPDQMRLSTRGSVAKLEGLTAFWRKYVGRMTVVQQQAFSERASELFEWNSPSDLGLSVNEPAVIDLNTTIAGLLANNEAPAEWIISERVAAAEHRVKGRFALKHVRLLGYGDESVVFTDEHTVYKCIDGWKTRMSHSQLEFLRTQVGCWTDLPGLYTLREVSTDEPWGIILTYDYETSTPYHGGHEEKLIQLMNGCSAAMIVCNNVHPKNLIVTTSEVKLIDHGADTRPWSPLGFEHMARRAFLACRHATHPKLHSLMRQALTDPHLPEMAGYNCFRERLKERPRESYNVGVTFGIESEAPVYRPFSLYVGIISSDSRMLGPLLNDLAALQTSDSINRLVVLVLDNGSPAGELDGVVRYAQQEGLAVAVVSEAQQCRDAAKGSFGAGFRSRTSGQVGIAQARTMLQRYLGELLEINPGSFGWILDDDMRVDDRARAYLPWLPAFREEGVDTLLGSYEGSSPNPPLNGLRVHLVDLYHNLAWLQNLPPKSLLPDRSAENAVMRDKFPDYYYDLSRKHSGHLEMPHWLEPVFIGETVAEAYSRLLIGATGILSGEPLTRPIISNMPSNPLASAKDSVNRGGCTFILNHRTLTLASNTILLIHGREARRSDMIWAIVNRDYRRMKIKAVSFPVQHVGRITQNPSLNVEKVQGEILGSALYAGLSDFLNHHAGHTLNFSKEETQEVRRLAEENLARRVQLLEQSFYRISGLSKAIQRIARSGELDEFLGYLRSWFTQENFDRICSCVCSYSSSEVESFLASLRDVSDDFAMTTVNVDFILKQYKR